jgi:hypothetical protein
MPVIRAKMTQKKSRKTPSGMFIFRRKGWGWLLVAVVIFDSLLATGAWFAVGYVVQ